MVQGSGVPVKQPDWQAFEEKVGRVLRLLGYDVTPNTEVRSAQTDLMATSKRRNHPNLLVECKFHRDPRNKVGIDEVENFSARTTLLRAKGRIDHGYLITNTGFTAPARGSLDGESEAAFVFLCTYDELLHTILDVDLYLREFARRYESSGEVDSYYDLSCADVSALSSTLFDPEVEHSVPSDSDARQVVLRATPAEISTWAESGWCSGEGPTEIDVARVRESAKRVSGNRDRYDYFRAEGQSRTVSSEAGFEAQLSASLADRRDPWPTGTEEYLERVGRELEARANPAAEFKFDLRSAAVKHAAMRSQSALPGDFAGVESLAAYRARLPAKHLVHRIARILRDLSHRGWRMRAPNRVAVVPCVSAAERVQEFLASDSRVMVLLGDYGAGKSTVMKRVMYDLAQEILLAEDSATDPVPLLLNLRDYNKVPHFDRLMLSFLRDEVGALDITLPVFRSLNDEGQFVLLFDGFDEMARNVTPAQRRVCFNEMADFVGPRAKVIPDGTAGLLPRSARAAGCSASAHASQLRERGDGGDSRGVPAASLKQ